jgi:hypothetical protein
MKLNLIISMIFLLLIAGCLKTPPAQQSNNQPKPPPVYTPPPSPESLVSVALDDDMRMLKPYTTSGVIPEGVNVRVDPVVVSTTTSEAISCYPLGAFVWVGQIPPRSTIKTMVGLADAPPGVFPVMGLVPPITRYGPQDARPPKGLRYVIQMNGKTIIDKEVPRDKATKWTPVELPLSTVSSDAISLTFITEGIFEGRVLPYWVNPIVENNDMK